MSIPIKVFIKYHKKSVFINFFLKTDQLSAQIAFFVSIVTIIPVLGIV